MGNMELFVEFLCTVWVVCREIFLSVFYTFVSPPLKSVKGDIVLITGAGSGLGRLMAIEFAKLGAVIVSWDVSNKGNEETAQAVRKIGGTVFTYSVDVSNRDAVNKVGEQVKQEVGEVSILVNNAGIVSGKSIIDLTDDQIKKTFDVNVLSHFWTTKCFLPSMMSRDHGHIVTLASIAGHIAGNKLGDYCASKFGAVGFGETLDLEIVADGKNGVHTTLVCPYYINTGMFDGATNRFPKLIPTLEPEYVVERIMHAVLTNQKQLYIPRTMYALATLKSLLPVNAMETIHKFLGASSMMDTFVGRQKRE